MPCGEGARPGCKSPGSKHDVCLTFFSLLTGMVVVGGRPLPGEVSEGIGRARLCVHVKLWTLNFATDQELLNRRVKGRVNATSSA